MPGFHLQGFLLPLPPLLLGTELGPQSPGRRALRPLVPDNFKQRKTVGKTVGKQSEIFDRTPTISYIKNESAFRWRESIRYLTRCLLFFKRKVHCQTSKNFPSPISPSFWRRSSGAPTIPLPKSPCRKSPRSASPPPGPCWPQRPFFLSS
jgi:hypothetical protein